MKNQNTEQQHVRIQTPTLSAEAEKALQSDTRGINPLKIENANFKTELEYEGYERIEDYDNTALEANSDELETSDKELAFEERDRPSEEDTDEENLIDPQDHKDDRNPA